METPKDSKMKPFIDYLVRTYLPKYHLVRIRIRRPKRKPKDETLPLPGILQ